MLQKRFMSLFSYSALPTIGFTMSGILCITPAFRIFWHDQVLGDVRAKHDSSFCSSAWEMENEPDMMYLYGMNKSVEIIRTTRAHALEFIEDLTVEQINMVPVGFNNNVIWNIAHLVAAQQGVCYKRAGLELRIDEGFFQKYKPGSRPEAEVNEREAELIKGLLFSTLEQLQTDYQNGLFANYTPWVTRYGVKIDSIDDAIHFLPFHEGLHLGYVMALKRVVIGQP